MAKRKAFDLDDMAVNSPAAEEEIVSSPAASRVTASSDKVESIKRLTIDMPSSLHTSLKIRAFEEGVTMAKYIRNLLEEQV